METRTMAEEAHYMLRRVKTRLLKWIQPLRQTTQKLLLRLRSCLLSLLGCSAMPQTPLGQAPPNLRRRKFQMRDGRPLSPSDEVPLQDRRKSLRYLHYAQNPK